MSHAFALGAPSEMLIAKLMHAISPQESSVRVGSLGQHRRHDSSPNPFGDLSMLHPGGDRLPSQAQTMHARRHSAAGALTGMLSGSPPPDQHRRRMRQEDLDAVRAARAQVNTAANVFWCSSDCTKRRCSTFSCVVDISFISWITVT